MSALLYQLDGGRKVDKRFSDDALDKFYTEFKAHRDEQTRQIDQIVDCQRRNADSIERLERDTRDVVQLYQDLQGATRLGITVQKIAMWVVKWPLIGAGLLTLYHWIVTNFPR